MVASPIRFLHSMMVRVLFDELQATHAGTMLPMEWTPPLNNGTT